MQRVVAIGVLTGLGFAPAVRADVDTLHAVYDLTPLGSTLPEENVVAGQLGGFGFDPTANKLYVAAVGSAQGLFRIDNVANGTGLPTRLVTASQYQGFTYTRQPVPFGLALNPVTFNGQNPYTVAYLTDAHGAGTAGDLGTTRRLYSWNLQLDTGAAGASTALSPALSAQQIITASGTGTANPAVIRQPRFGNDGKSVYFAVGATNTNGIYRYDAVTSSASRVPTVSAAALPSQELGVFAVSSTVDRLIYSDSASNLVAIDYNTSAGTYGAQQTLLTQAEIRDFLRGTSAQTFSINNVVTDSAGNVYFQTGTGQTSQPRNAFLRLDKQTGVNRLAKVTTQNEIRTLRSGQGNTFTGTQIHAGTYTGSNGTFGVNQLYFGNTVASAGYIAKVDLLLPGDFNRDNAVTVADAATLRNAAALKPIGTTTADSNFFKFDLNGDSTPGTTSASYTAIVDYYDVKAFQKFLPFANGDADMNLSLDFGDINAARDHYLATGTVWTDGNFNDDTVVNAADLLVLANAWVYDLGQSRLTASQIDAAGYVGQFRDDLVTAFNVPEPASLGLLAVAGLLAGRRRRSNG